MDADEKISALKSAYAGIILNITKETTNRVMASEKRALHCQHEMKMAKEESLRMLMRMKHMMDSKISEGEASSSNQQKKILELEAQLGEAEDIVRDLREELAQVQGELQSVKNCSLHRENEVPLDITEYSHHPSLHGRSAAKIPYLDQQVCCQNCYTENRELPSVVLRGEDSSLYRNGRTQRIRACERNGLGSEVRNRKEDEVPEKPSSCTKTTNGTDLENDVTFGSSKSFPCKRKRAARQRNSLTALSGKELLDKSSLETQTLSSDTVTTEASETEKNGVDQKMFLSEHGRFVADKNDEQFQSVEDPSELNEASPCRSPRGKEIKYTFQRKRKIQAKGPEAKIPIETETKESVGKDSNGKHSESRECRRTAQVARQLLSLSERKWWD